jgi:hypothetical protein
MGTGVSPTLQPPTIARGAGRRCACGRPVGVVMVAGPDVVEEAHRAERHGPPARGGTRGVPACSSSGAAACPPPERVRRTRPAGGAGQASRGISTARLHVSPRVHLPPIDVIVSHAPSGADGPKTPGPGVLILGWASHLDAFSGYPVPTSLPGGAPGGTTGTRAVGPSRSSRTRDGSPQHSNAHDGYRPNCLTTF